MKIDEERFLLLLSLTAEPNFTESPSVDSSGTVLCAENTEMNKTLS